MYWHLYADVHACIHPLENVHKICLPWLAFQHWGVRSCCWSTLQSYLRSHGWWLPPHPCQWTGAQAMWGRRDVADIIIVTMFLHVKAVGNFQIFAFFVGMLANMKIKTTKIWTSGWRWLSVIIQDQGCCSWPKNTMPEGSLEEQDSRGMTCKVWSIAKFVLIWK